MTHLEVERGAEHKEDHRSQHIYMERIFYELLTRVGANGRYQKICLIIWCCIYMPLAASAFFNPFLFYQSPYAVDGMSQKDSLSYVCSLSSQQREAFVYSKSSTLIDEYGDFRCREEINKVNQAQLIIYLGGVLGLVIGALISSIIRKRILIIASIIIEIAGMVLTMANLSLPLVTAALFINYAARSILAEIVICYITQTVQQQQRGKQIMILLVFYSIGVSLNGFFFYLFPWRTVIFIYLIVPETIGLLGMLFFVRDTPFDVITNYSAEKSLTVFKQIATINQRQDHKLNLAGLEDIQRLYRENLLNKKQNTLSIIDLFRFKSLRKDTICCILLHFLIYYEFTAPEIALSEYSADIYFNGMFIGFSQTISCVVFYYLVDFIPRKKLINWTSLIALAISFPIFMFANCKTTCSLQAKWLQSGGLFIFRMMISTTYTAFYLYQNEVFPTQIRSLAVLLSGFASGFSPVLVPIASKISNDTDNSIVASFFITCLIVLLITMIIPQTYGVQPPQMIKQLNYDNNPEIKVIPSSGKKEIQMLLLNSTIPTQAYRL